MKRWMKRRTSGGSGGQQQALQVPWAGHQGHDLAVHVDEALDAREANGNEVLRLLHGAAREAQQLAPRQEGHARVGLAPRSFSNAI